MRRHTGTISVGLAGLVLLWALVAPTLRANAFQGLVESAIEDVEALREASLETLLSSGSWPTPAGPSVSPPEVAGAVTLDGRATATEFVLEWRVVNTVTLAEVPLTNLPPAIQGDEVLDSLALELVQTVHTHGTIVVYSSNDALLAALRSQHGDSVSFVRDTTWTLLVRSPDGS